MPTIACINATSRTMTYLTTQSLTSSFPTQVRAIVRSEKRFLSKLPPSVLSSGKAPSELTIHEYSNYSDPTPLISILEGVDTVFVALGINDNKPTTLNQDVLQALVSALATSKPQSSSRSPTKIVLLSAYPVTPYNLTLLANGHTGMMERFIHNTLLANQYADLIRAEAFLMKQSPWLDWTVISPGMIADDTSPEEEDDTKATFSLAIQDPAKGGDEPRDAISYARLARAMVAASQDKTLVGKHVSPVATGRKVQVGWQGMEVQREVLGSFLTSQFLPAATRILVYGALCGGLGYMAGGGKVGGFELS